MTRIGHKNPASRRKGRFSPPCEGESLAELVDTFEKAWVPFLIDELKFYERQRSLEEAIRAATEKGHSHLTRIPPGTLRTARGRLLNSAELRGKLIDFDELYATVEEEIGGIYGISLVTTYDIAHHLGAYLRLEPQSVYLHAGAKKGAQILEVGRGKRKVAKEAFPVEIQRLEPQFIEDFLCICQQGLVRWKASNPTPQPDA